MNKRDLTNSRVSNLNERNFAPAGDYGEDDDNMLGVSSHSNDTNQVRNSPHLDGGRNHHVKSIESKNSKTSIPSIKDIHMIMQDKN